MFRTQSKEVYVSAYTFYIVVCAFLCVRTCMCVCVCMCACVMCACVHVCVHVCMCACVNGGLLCCIQESGGYQTTGIDMLVTGERVVLLDTQVCLYLSNSSSASDSCVKCSESLSTIEYSKMI